jgi:serine-type D-Ala-D-Ala carboxypeptidase/endopeptidase
LSAGSPYSSPVMIVSCAGAFTQVPSDIEIRKILADRIGAENLGIGIVVGVIDSNGRRVVGYGSLAKNDRCHLDGDTVFEIGSLTKVSTSLLLMDMTRRGEVALTRDASRPLNEGIGTSFDPTYNRRARR